MRPLKQDTLPQDAATAIPWKLDISLRSAEATELYTHLQRLVGNGITQLALLRIRPTPEITSRLWEVIHWLRTHALMSDGATCYLNSTLQAQLWAQAMTAHFTAEAWDAWQQTLTRLLTSLDTGPLDPCRDALLGEELRSWFSSRPAHATLHGWEARLRGSTEDRSTVVAPIVLRNMPFDHTTLHQLIEAWHDSKPYTNALCCSSPMVCVQLERYSGRDTKNSCAVTWHRSQHASVCARPGPSD